MARGQGSAATADRGLMTTFETAVGQAIARVQATCPGSSVSTARLVSNALLVGAGVPTYSGAFRHPVPSAWIEIYPGARYRSVYNRHAHVVFQLDVQGEPLQNPQADVIMAESDPCAAAARRRVAHLLTEAPADRACLRLVEHVPIPAPTLYLHDVVPG